MIREEILRENQTQHGRSKQRLNKTQRYVKPVNQTNTLASSTARHHPHRRSGVSVGSNQSAVSIDSDEVKDLMLKDDDVDEVKDHAAHDMQSAGVGSKISDDQSSDLVTL